jgi:hypothetical protein
MVQRPLTTPLERASLALHLGDVQLALDALHEAVTDAWFMAGQSSREPLVATDRLGQRRGMVVDLQGSVP